MTTVAYREGVLAADSLMTASGLRSGHRAKVMRHGRLLIGFCGSSANFEAFWSWLAAGMEGQFKSEGGNVFIIAPGVPPIVWGDRDYPWRETAPFWALGSGEHIAIGAMAAGASAEEAIAAAIQFDTSSGGEITVLRH